MVNKGFLLFLMLLSTMVSAQNKFNITGMVTDTDGALIAEGEAALLNTSGLIITRATITGGKFLLEAINEGNYTIQVTAIGFEDALKVISVKETTVVTIQVTKKVTVMDELTIAATQKTFTTQHGNIKVDVANSIYKSITNPLDLLSKLPMVLVSADKQSINVIGRGSAIIYIDNQSVSVEELNSLSVDDIKTIEVITNPSSKYEADGMAVILITRKLSKKEGMEVTLSENASFKREFNNYLGMNSRFKRSRTEFKANFNYNYLQPWESADGSLNINEGSIITDSKALSLSDIPQYIVGGGMYHQINDDDYIAINANARLQEDAHSNRFDTYFKQNDTEQNIITLSDNDGSRKYVNTYINYSKKLKSIDAKLTTGLQYSTFHQAVVSNIENSFDAGSFEPAQYNDQKFKVDAYTARADFEKVYKNEMKWEAGALYLSADANTNFIVIYLENLNTTQSQYNFKEKNIAAYTQLSGKYKRFTYTAGVRTETTDIEGKYKNNENNGIAKNYTNLFPKLQIDFAIDSTNTISLNYAKSISRPNYSSTSQVKVYNSPYMVYSRNITLNPSITDEVFASYQYLDKSLKLSYYTTSNPTYSNYSYDETQNLINFSTVNYKREHGFMLQALLPFTYKSWSSTTVLAGVVKNVQDDTAVFQQAKPYLYYYSNHYFKLPKDYTAIASFWGVTRRNEGALQNNAVFILDLGLTKTFFKVLDLTLSYNDVFRGMTYKGTVTKNNIYSMDTFYVDMREISISLRYKFGTIKDAAYKEIKVDEGNRVN
jgi:hypothetical protein